jgi:hypothetical protein
MSKKNINAIRTTSTRNAKVYRVPIYTRARFHNSIPHRNRDRLKGRRAG